MVHRSFIGIFPTQEVISQLARLQSYIKKLNTPFRWEEQIKFHITLSFLGDKDEVWLQELFSNLTKTFSSQKKFSISLLRFGLFSQRAIPRTLWIGSHREENFELCTIADAVQNICVELGHTKEEKTFHPHITIGRAKAQRRISLHLITKIENTFFEPLQFACNEIRIMKSVLHEKGSHYTTLFTVPLR